MPWYKVYCDSGPGHQSHHEFYHWEEKKLTREEQRELFEESFKDRDWPIGDVKLLRFLPSDVKKAKITSVQGQLAAIPEEIKRLKQFLEIINQTETKGCAHLYTTLIRELPPGSYPVTQCKSCKKIRIYGKQNWRKMPKNLARAAMRIR